MIRAAGILAVVATSLILALFLRTLRSHEVTATVVRANSEGVGNDGSWPIQVRLSGHLEGDQRWGQEAAGVPLVLWDQGDDDDRIWTWIVPAEIVKAARAGDGLIFRSKRLRLKFLGHWKTMHYELRGSSVQFFSGPENNKFVLIVAVILGGPISLWGLAALIAGLSGDRARPRRGPSTSLPDSPGTPGSP